MKRLIVGVDAYEDRNTIDTIPANKTSEVTPPAINLLHIMAIARFNIWGMGGDRINVDTVRNYSNNKNLARAIHDGNSILANEFLIAPMIAVRDRHVNPDFTAAITILGSGATHDDILNLSFLGSCTSSLLKKRR